VCIIICHAYTVRGLCNRPQLEGNQSHYTESQVLLLFYTECFVCVRIDHDSLSAEIPFICRDNPWGLRCSAQRWKECTLPSKFAVYSVLSYLWPKINNDMFISGYQLRRLDRYHVLCTRRPFVLGLDILCSSNCGKCFMFYPVPSILLDSDIPLTLGAWIVSLALPRKPVVFVKIQKSLYPPHFSIRETKFLLSSNQRENNRK
jgi:hypothetical protein